jgi:hypothetical protein
MKILSRVSLAAAGAILSAGTLAAGEKGLMHCFAFTPIETASQAEWDAFWKATDDLPKKIPGMKRVWYGKLLKPVNLVMGTADAEGRKKLAAGENVTGDLNLVRRSYGVCMEFNNSDALAAYAKHDEHDKWLKQYYEKVRKAGTTTFDIVGQ